ncbi:MAG: ABC transporter substrate-binding protein [Pseudodesulfovibrio sp.]|uniref:ABC transporter substrate-binding protein n=1 Tax=Pseudodesulfovibrio sp. TaxID=2035812 RepID=UPI003D11E002
MVIYCVALALVAGTALSAQAAATIAPGVIAVGTDLTYPPYNYFDDNEKPAGFDVELMTAIAGKAGMKIEFHDTRFENLIMGVRGGQFDVIASTLYVKPARAKQIDYIPYMKTGVSIAVATASGLSFAAPESLCGRKVGSIKGGAWIEKLNELAGGVCKDNPVDSREFPTSPEVTQALLSGGVDAQMEDSAVLQSAVAKLNGRLQVTSTENLYPVVVGFGVRKGNAELADILRKALKELEADGTYPALLKKYNVSKPTEAEFKAAVGE